MRQVRLEDDVTALVEQYQAAEGLPSLSAAVNRMLRLAAGPEEPVAVGRAECRIPLMNGPCALPAGHEGIHAEREDLARITPAAELAARAAVAIVTPRSRRRPPPTTSRRPAASPAGALARCPHPLLERQGGRCGRCGVTL